MDYILKRFLIRGSGKTANKNTFIDMRALQINDEDVLFCCLSSEGLVKFKKIEYLDNAKICQEHNFGECIVLVKKKDVRSVTSATFGLPSFFQFDPNEKSTLVYSHSMFIKQDMLMVAFVMFAYPWEDKTWSIETDDGQYINPNYYRHSVSSMIVKHDGMKDFVDVMQTKFTITNNLLSILTKCFNSGKVFFNEALKRFSQLLFAIFILKIEHMPEWIFL